MAEINSITGSPQIVPSTNTLQSATNQSAEIVNIAQRVEAKNAQLRAQELAEIGTKINVSI
jgi:phage-related protein